MDSRLGLWLATDVRRVPFPAFLASLCVLVVGCASQRPVLYPNEQYRRSGQAAADQAIAECMRQAEQFVASGGTSADLARGVGTPMAVGATGRGPDPVYANFVDRCLRERGYEPIGWK